jgi:hypothetical protein
MWEGWGANEGMGNVLRGRGWGTEGERMQDKSEGILYVYRTLQYSMGKARVMQINKIRIIISSKLLQNCLFLIGTGRQIITLLGKQFFVSIFVSITIGSRL